jgi:putative endonuclease
MLVPVPSHSLWGMDDRPAYVYLLRCRGGSLYCGWTLDVERRLAAHQAGKGARYTRRRLPVELAAVIELPNESAARREEARIKQLKRSEKLALVEAHGSGHGFAIPLTRQTQG